MNAISFAQHPLFAPPAQTIVLQLQCIKLENELAEIQERERREKRRRRRKAVMQQMEQLQALVSELKTTRQKHSIPHAGRSERQTVPLYADVFSSIERMMLKLVQQNEEISTFLRSHQAQNQMPVRTSAQQSEADCQQEKDEECRKADFTPIPQQGTLTNMTSFSSHNADEELVSALWTSRESHPEVEWTDADDELLEKLLGSGQEQGVGILPLPGVINEGEGSEPEDITTILEENAQKKRDRNESRRKVSQLIDTAFGGNSSGLHRPQWRITQDVVNGVVMPLNENGEVAEIPMTTRQVFRAATIAIMAANALKRLSLGKQLRVKEKSIRDLESMINVYFDATQAWLSKVVKTPLGSVVQDQALDLDISTKSTIFQAPRGLSSWFNKRKSNPQVVVPQSASVNQDLTSSAIINKSVKLKVRVKGLIDALVKALDKKDVPHGIEEFWKRITTDGVYFPPSYRLSAYEASVLDFDSLGATRNMGACNTRTGKPHFHVVWINFVLLRVLIPHVILGAAGDLTPKSVTTNLRNVATLMYWIISRLSPLPPILHQEIAPPIRLAGRRRSVEVTPEENRNQMPIDESKRFLSLQDIHARLIPEHQFPFQQAQLNDFCNEQQSRLHDVLQRLQVKLHGVAASSQ